MLNFLNKRKIATIFVSTCVMLPSFVFAQDCKLGKECELPAYGNLVIPIHAELGVRYKCAMRKHPGSTTIIHGSITPGDDNFNFDTVRFVADEKGTFFQDGNRKDVVIKGSFKDPVKGKGMIVVQNVSVESGFASCSQTTEDPS